MGVQPGFADDATAAAPFSGKESARNASDGHARENRYPEAITCKQSVNASKIHVSSLVEREADRFLFAFVRKPTSAHGEKRTE